MSDRETKPSDVPHIGDDDQIDTPRQVRELPNLDQLAGLNNDIFDSLEAYFQWQRSNQ